MMPFRIFRRATRSPARTSAGFLLGAVVFANFFLLTLYVQQVLHYSALEDGPDVPRDGRHRDPGCRAVSQALVTKIGAAPGARASGSR